MNLEIELQRRSGNKCELCTSENDLNIVGVGPNSKMIVDDTIYVCHTCFNQINNKDEINANHWRCLNESMWSEVEAVKVVAWRMLNRLKAESWPQDLLDMMYLDVDTLKWAKAEGDDLDESEKVIHKDINGVVLESGDSVVLIKDLKVSGGGFTAKRGTAVRRISLDMDNSEYIEGRVDGQQIVILTQYVKKL